MELTIEQALEKGVSAHNSGNLQEAERLYRAILQSQPRHPDASHNLGLIAISVRQIEAALPFFKTALEVNPTIEQFWVSYIDALVKTNQRKDAKKAVNQAKKNGFDGKKLDALLLQQKVIRDTKEPPQEQLVVLLEHYQSGRLGDAEKLATAITQEFPKHQFGWKVLGAVYQVTDRMRESLIASQKCVELGPQDAEANYNLGVLLQEQARLEEAKESYAQAIALKPDYAEAHTNLGNTLKELGRSKEAEASFRQALALQPDFAEAHFNLGITLKELGRLDEVEANLRQATILKPDFVKAYDHLGDLLQILGRFEDAEVCYKKCISLAPFELPITKSMASRLYAQGELEKSLSLFDSYNTPDSRSRAIECLYALRNTKEIYKRIENTAELDDGNLKIAAFASFIAETQQEDTAHRFCRKPLDFLHFSNLSSKVENSNSFITNLIGDLKNIGAIWQPPNQSGNGGFKTIGNLFRYSSSNIVTLKEIILSEIDVYYKKFQNEKCSFIEKWPAEKDITGWHIMLKEQGYHNLHIHQDGWLSGVIYLKVVPSLDENEGAIIFDMAVPNISESRLPKIIHNPQKGDMVLFPSSLYHGTIPFSTDTDRIVVSFDLKPNHNK
jgi:tetratricopeptide (TPR) repeat protein|tara:strand:- start:912 stop:2753 length:1842 start_codon:yes stop_codon:yes gene_type:complete